MNNSLISSFEVKKESFNSLILLTNGMEQFLAYFSLLLFKACEVNLISGVESDVISKKLVNYLMNEFDGDEQLVSNNLYVLTCYLSTMENYEQLIFIKDNDSEKVFRIACEYFLNELKKIEENLESVRLKVNSFKCPNISKAYNGLKANIDTFKAFSFDKSQCFFKHMNESLIGGDAFLYREITAENFLELLNAKVNAFRIEVGIFEKIGIPEIYQNLKASIQFEKDSISNNFESSLNKLKRMFEDIANWRKEALDECKKYDEKMEEIEKVARNNFAKENPNLSGDEFEEAFWEWQSTLPDSHFNIPGIKYYDEIVIEAKYKDAYNELKRRETKMEKSHDKKLEKINNSDFTMFMGISYAIKIRLLTYMALEGKISVFPKTVSELEALIIGMETEKTFMAISKYISFSEEEKMYLGI